MVFELSSKSLRENWILEGHGFSRAALLSVL